MPSITVFVHRSLFFRLGFSEGGASCRVGVGVSVSVVLALLILPLAAGTISVAPVPAAPAPTPASVPLSTSKTVNAIASLANSTWSGSGSGSGIVASDARNNRFLSSIARSLPPASFEMEASHTATSRSSECIFHFGGPPSRCSDKDSRPNPTGRRFQEDGRGGKVKKKKLLKKWALPLLIGYKLKFLVLVPLLFATLALLVASTGFAGFFFAMFTAAIALPKSGHYGR